mgnify:CR=1 FL=1|tara:strand:+ start:175 stop:1752 length:1578 start_codon:yes stop_codon:yes gene_type:complete
MEEWNRLSNLLLEKNHIKLPMEKRFFLSFLEDDTDSISKQKVLNKLETMGFLKDDPRLTTIRGNLKALTTSNSIKYEEFKYCIENNVCIISKILTQDLIIPNFDTFTRKMKTIYEETKQDNKGNVASYIPQLKRVNPDQYGLSVCTIDGQRYNLGDTKVDFTVQSCCKPINYGIALEELGEEEVHRYVGREPSGQSFNELTLNKDGKPHNPLINSGAIMTSSLIKYKSSLAERFEHITNIWTRLSGGIYKIGFNNSVYLSEKETADRNYALAYFMKERNEKKTIGFPDDTNLDTTLELYFQCCSIEVNAEILSIVASTLANGGVNPFTGERIWSASTVKNVLSMMLMCGMYDYSGECAFKIGIPCKSGVAGAIMIVIPNVMGVVTWSPALDPIGNSYRGIQFCELFGKTFNFHIFDSLSDNTKINPLADTYSSNKLNEFSELCLASQQGDIEHLKKLFNLEIDMNQADYDGRTALHLATCENHIDIVKFLIQVAKVKKTPKDRWNNTPLDEAVKLNHNEIVHLLQ